MGWSRTKYRGLLPEASFLLANLSQPSRVNLQDVIRPRYCCNVDATMYCVLCT